MKVRCYMSFHSDPNPLVDAISLDFIDRMSEHTIEINREEFEKRVIAVAIDPAQDMLMVHIARDRRVLGLVGTSKVFCYEFETELAAELIFQLFNTSRREWRKTQDAPF